MSKLIRKIIKEAIEEFDWVDTEPDLYRVIDNYLQNNHPDYWIKRSDDRILISDKTGTYVSMRESVFTIEEIKLNLTLAINRLIRSKELGWNNQSLIDEYLIFVKVLEPIIGPININLNESEEFDWVDTEPDLYRLIDNYFKNNHPDYWIKRSGDMIHISDISGIYVAFGWNELTIETIRDGLKDSIKILPGRDNIVRNDYLRLVKVLEPIIGPLNLDWQPVSY